MQSIEEKKTELAESLHQFITIWKLLTKPFPEADQSDKPGLSISWANTAFPFYNMLFLTEQFSDANALRNRVHEAAAYMRAHQQSGMLVVCVDELTDSAKDSLDEITAQEKLTPLPMTGMAGNILPLESPTHSMLRFVRISDDATIQTFAEINCAAYNIPVVTALSLVKQHDLWKDHAYGFIAYEGNKPVATATAIVNEGCLFLFLVATMPEAQRKGYGDAVVRHALNTAYEATGIRRTVLHATNAGYPVYLRIGYHTTGNFLGYLPMSEPDTNE